MTKPPVEPRPSASTSSSSRSICVFCGSSSGADPGFARTAKQLGAELAAAGHNLVYGGGHVGLMGIVADSALSAGGTVTGVMTEQLVEAEVAHHGLTELDVQPTMHAREARMAELSDGVVVLPGGFGTWEEAVELLTWNQLGIVSLPMVFLDVNGFFDPFFAFIEAAVTNAFINADNAALAVRVDDVADAVRQATRPAPAYRAKWVG